jgi:hypothetical protein
MSDATSRPAALSACPNCSRSVREGGRYCPSCGAILEHASCSACDEPLLPGDRHCASCGTAVGASAEAKRTGDGQRTAWTVAGIAFVALALVVLLQRASDRRARDAAAVTAPGSVQGQPNSNMPSAQDIASMSPREQMDRLYDRIMRLRDEGKIDSVRFFAPMVMGLYDRPELQPLDADLRYDIGTVANAAQMYQIEKAQSDTILAAAPNHLLGLLMAARSARATNDAETAARLERRLLAEEAAERRKALPEYERHRAEIDDALRKARP